MPNTRKQLGTSLEYAVVDKAKAKGLRSRRQPLSGVLKDFPNDVEIERLLVECKVRSAKLDAKGRKTITLDLDWLHGVVGNAEKAGYEAGVVVVRPKGSQHLYVLADFDYFTDALLVPKRLTVPGSP